MGPGVGGGLRAGFSIEAACGCVLQRRRAARQEELDDDFSYARELRARERRLQALEEQLERKARWVAVGWSLRLTLRGEGTAGPKTGLILVMVVLLFIWKTFKSCLDFKHHLASVLVDVDMSTSMCPQPSGCAGGCVGWSPGRSAHPVSRLWS